jgi:RNA polymerase sigma-70 factor (ECF subfamily)
MGAGELALIERALAGERAGMKDLVDLLTPVVQARVNRKLFERGPRGRDLRQEVADFTQEVFLSLFDQGGRALRAWDPERGLTLKSFVGLLAERQIVSVLRSGRRSPFTEEPTEPASLMEQGGGELAERKLESREELGLLWESLVVRQSALGLDMFRRLFVECQSPEQIQRELRMSADAVYAWRSRLRRQVIELARELDTPLGDSLRRSAP